MKNILVYYKEPKVCFGSDLNIRCEDYYLENEPIPLLVIKEAHHPTCGFQRFTYIPLSNIAMYEELKIDEEEQKDEIPKA